MEPNTLNNEKEVLIERIKGICCMDKAYSKWSSIVFGILSVVMMVLILIWGSVRQDLYMVVMFLYIGANDYISTKYSKVIEPITDAQELIRQYDKREKVNTIAGFCFVIVIFAILVFLRHDYILAGVLFGLFALISLIIWAVKGFKNKDVERLRELVRKENL